MERYICIHGHFYQPPRENAWLEAIELQDSAYPYHDWNERITAECYAPNMASRILGREDWIVKVVNTYAKISFNFGPSLLAWLEEKAPEVYQAILVADRESREAFSGHGSALAQAYNHMIMPLANRRDKYTQVLWGVWDFELRFGRAPEGMWLPETAVDLETLDILAELGLQFTILAPYQAGRVRKVGDNEWQDVTGGNIDPTMAYELRLPSGRKISLFFYDGPISRAVAFEGLLAQGEHLARRLLSAFSEEGTWPQLVHIATDGETYGHHHRHGDMALAYAIDYIQSHKLAQITNYGEYLEKHPPTHEVEVVENTSWSCGHGVERWRSNCGCNSGMHPGWNQDWRAPLREALNWLRDTLALYYEEQGRQLLHDPWAARDDYIAVILDRSPESIAQFLSRHAAHKLSEAEKTTVLKLLELQRHAMLMFTSCGWFFDEISGIETVQVLHYAARALQLAQELFGNDIESQFLAMLEQAKSNIPEHRDGRHIYEKSVKPAMIDLAKVGAHYGVSSLFEAYPERARIYCYTATREDYQSFEAGRAKLVVGRVRVVSEVTRESAVLSVGVLHFGDHNLAGGVREFRGPKAYEALTQELTGAFARADFPEVIRQLDRHFRASTYSLKSLFRDEQRKILNQILEATLAGAGAVYRQIYEHHAPLMRFLSDLGAPLPKAFLTAAEVVLNTDLRRAFKEETLDPDHARALLEEARTWQVELDIAGLAYALKQTGERTAEQFWAEPDELSLLQRLEAVVDLARSLPFAVDLWKAQNIYYEMLQRVYPGLRGRAEQGDESAQIWANHFTSLGEKLAVRVLEMKVNETRTAPTVAALAQELAAQQRIPCATYRLQFNRAFTFRDAQAIVPYLHDLGIGDCYASPLLKARPGSTHGYDICDHSQLNPDLGTEEDFEAFAAALRARGMGLVLDLVPNHMGIGDSNLWWMDVLENGPSSTYASYFDIDWHPAPPELENKVLLPILESHYGKVLEGGKFRLAHEDGAFFVYYNGTKLPVAPCTYTSILGYQLGALAEALGEENEHLRELQSILTALNYLPSRTELAADKIAERQREKEVIKRRIAALYHTSPEVRAAIDAAVQAFNATEGNPRSFDLLDALLNAQAYRPAFWRVAAEETNYRRFFDINDMAAIRVELPQVFQAAHDLVLRLLTEGKVSGLRIDHADGLWNPASYFRQLQESYVIHQVHSRLGPKAIQNDPEGVVAAWFAAQPRPNEASAPSWPLYVVAEKILSEGESLPQDWAVHGTTGYDFLQAVNGLFVDSGNRKAFDRIYSRFIWTQVNFRNLVNSAKKMIMLVSLVSEVNMLAHQLERIAEKNRWYRDYTLNSLTFALREVIACLPVYRTYITGPDPVAWRDQEYIEAAVAEAKKRNPRTAEAIFDFIQESLLLRNAQDFREEDRAELTNFVMKSQQVTGPVMAKGVEDTAFYVYHRLVSLNEVGCNPEQFGVSVAAFHRQNAERHRRWPHSLLATSTHDTKRSEDVRARINVLSEMPEEWRGALARWSRLNAPKKTIVGGEPAPDSNDEYLLYQTLLGAWPLEPLTPEEFAYFRERIAAYMLKAAKEAKVHTSWVNPNEKYDAAVRNFVLHVLADGGENPFLNDLLALQRRVAYYGQLNALAQVLLKLTSPGVPDIYQGAELWDFSLVDPDNRRPVDYQRRHSLLADLKNQVERAGRDLTALAPGLLAASQDGRVKLYLTYTTLNFRRAHHQLFASGTYLPLEAGGEKQDHVCAFARILGDEAALVVTPRLVVRLTAGAEQPPLGAGVWKDTWLALPHEQVGRGYRNLFTGEVLAVADHEGMPGLPLAAICGHFPVALLERIAA